MKRRHSNFEMGGKSRGKALSPLLTPLSENPTEGPSHWAGLNKQTEAVRAGRPKGPSSAVVFRLEGASDSNGELVKTDCQGSRLRVSDSLGQGWGLRICMSSKFPGDADAAIPGTTV